MDDFAPPPVVREHGDRLEAAALRPMARRELAAMHRQNTGGLDAVSRTVRLDDGRVILCRRQAGQDMMDLYAPIRREGRPPTPPPRTRRRPGLDGSFFVIPGCVARYDGVSGLENAIPDGPLAGSRLGTGLRVSLLPFADTDLPDPGVVPETGDERVYNAFRLPGGEGSGLLYGPGHIPASGAFSISCLFRLTQRLDYDYAFEDRGVLSPIRPYVLETLDREAFTWSCPGSLSPVAGSCQPDFHPGWTEEITYPWPPHTGDFSRPAERLTGIRRVSESCPDAPLLAPDGPGESPYRDDRGDAYPHPHGFVTGMRLAGLFIVDGDRLLAGRLADVEADGGLAPIRTPPLPLWSWRHAVFSCAADGAAVLSLAAQDQTPEAWAAYAAPQSARAMDMGGGYAASGVNSGHFISENTGERISGFRMNAALDVALVRFFHHALDADQARLLHFEAFRGEFAADDFEAGPLAAKGLSPIVIGRQAQ
ncbi:MAG: hypothetical protein RDU30_06685 [Desulfovibrionaceae bacterium]|nr:hypothetical protein [Desulfovibrionaceae bacterium]